MQNSEFLQFILPLLLIPLQKQLDLDVLDNLPYAQFSARDNKKVTELVAPFGNGKQSLATSPTTKNELGLYFNKTVTLKHSRSGRHEIDGQYYECLRISSVGYCSPGLPNSSYE